MNSTASVSPRKWERILHQIGAPFHEQLATWRDTGLLFLELFYRFFQPSSWRKKEIIQAIVQIGIESLPIIIIATTFAGLIITNEMAWHMNISLHTVSLIPGVTGQFILRELGIAVPALQMVAKVGAATTAEIGTMKVTDQIDALKLLRIDPISYLVFPRFIAAIVSGACLTLIAITITVSCAILVAVTKYNFSVLEYLNALQHSLNGRDIICALVKGIIYGALIPVISCAYGFRCRGGAEGVGAATTHSVVTSTVAIICLDFILTYLFSHIL